MRLDNGFWNLLGFKVLLDKVSKVKFLVGTLAEHDIVDLLLNRGEYHHILPVQVPEKEPPYHQGTVIEQLLQYYKLWISALSVIHGPRSHNLSFSVP